MAYATPTVDVDHYFLPLGGDFAFKTPPVFLH